ncbi:hypothetical protein BD560DRAFT_428655 [Blakeslea trispora]|nr:hypothetical protein BD560DRAFT_428655 [Blakeslea trispora]
MNMTLVVAWFHQVMVNPSHKKWQTILKLKFDCVIWMCYLDVLFGCIVWMLATLLCTLCNSSTSTCIVMSDSLVIEWIAVILNELVSVALDAAYSDKILLQMNLTLYALIASIRPYVDSADVDIADVDIADVNIADVNIADVEDDYAAYKCTQLHNHKDYL